jgi:phosphoglycolate phosphatase-like HAD superfamily hydrolase
MTSNKESVVLIGDTIHDLIGAEISNIYFIGVIYGFGAFDNLSKKYHKTLGYANAIEDIKDILCKYNNLLISR